VNLPTSLSWTFHSAKPRRARQWSGRRTWFHVHRAWFSPEKLPCSIENRHLLRTRLSWKLWHKVSHWIDFYFRQSHGQGSIETDSIINLHNYICEEAISRLWILNRHASGEEPMKFGVFPERNMCCVLVITKPLELNHVGVCISLQLFVNA